MQGDNLTIREIKDRLNETYLLYHSLSSRRDNSSVDLKKCACVVYLQRQYPDEFLNLTSKETDLSNLIEKISYTYYGDITKVSDVDFEFILPKDEKGKTIPNKDFIETFKKLLEEKDVENDYRMYFYNYPAASYVMNTKEKIVYDYITFDNTSIQKKELDEAIKTTINNFNGSVILKALEEIKATGNTYGTAVFQNALLFEFSSIHEQNYTLESFKVYFQLRLHKTAYADLCNIVENTLFDNQEYSYYRSEIIDLAIAIILDEYKITNEVDFLNITRSYILRSIKEDNIPLFTGLFISTNAIPIIDVDLLNVLTTPQSLFSCLNFKLINQNNYKPYFDCISSMIFNGKYAVILVKSIKKIQNLTTISGIEEYLIRIFENNQIWDSDLFLIIYDKYKNKPKIVLNLISKTNLELLTDDDYVKINDLKTNLIKDDTLLNELEKRNLFMSSVYSRLTSNNFEKFDFTSEQFLKTLPSIAQSIYSLDPECFVELRKVLIQHANLEYETVYRLFESSYPFISESELDLVKESKGFYWVIDFSNVNNQNCILIAGQCNKRQMTGESLYEFFYAIFLNESPYNICDPNIIWIILENIDFNKTQFFSIPQDKQEEVINFFDTSLVLSDKNNCLRFLKIINTHIQKLDMRIQDLCNENPELLNNYLDLCKKISIIPDYVISFIINNKAETAYPRFITDRLFQKKAYYLYIIGKSFEDQKAFYLENIPISFYQECFIQNDEYFELCNTNKELIKNIYLNMESFDNVNLDRLMSFVEFPQSFKLIKKILELSNNEQKREYLMNIKEISTYADSQKFCDEITGRQYAEIFKNDRNLYLHVLNLLWTKDGDNVVIDLHASFKQRMVKRYNISFR